MADPVSLPELRALIEAYEQADDREAVTGADDLQKIAQASIRAYADFRSWKATRGASRQVAEVADEWDLSKWTLAQRNSRHGRRKPQSEK